MAKDKQHGKPQARPVKPMKPALVEEMVVVMLRNRRVRAEAVQALKPAHFGRPDERHLAVLWSCVLDLHEGYAAKSKIPYVVLYSAVVEAADAAATMLTGAERSQLLDEDDDPPGVLYYAYHVFSKENADYDYGVRLLQRFLRERAVVQPLHEALAAVASGGRLPADLQGLLTGYASELGRIDSLAAGAFTGVKRPVSSLKPIATTSTGQAWLDVPFGGGPAECEVIGILGPINGGKSTLIRQLALSRAKVYRRRHREGGDHRCVLFFSYEDPWEPLCLNHILACEAKVPRSTMALGADALSTRGSLKPYELKEFKDADGFDPDTYDGELERIEKAMTRIDPYIRGVYMAGQFGERGVDEVVAMIEREIEQSGRRPGAVFIDSIDLLVRRHIEYLGRDPDRSLRLALSQAVETLRHKVAVAFKVDVWVTNQLSTDKLKASPGARLHFSDAAEAKNWARALDFHLTLGNRTAEDVAVLQMDKARRTEYNHHQMVVRLVKSYGRWVSAGSEYGVYQDRIQPHKLVNEFHGAAAAPATPAQFSPTAADVAAGPTDFFGD